VRIAVVVPGIAASESEWYIPAVEHYLKALATQNEVVVFTIHYPMLDLSYFWHHIQVFPSRKPQDRWEHLRNVRKLIQTHGPFDLIHAFGASEAGVVAVRAGEQLGIPAVVTVINDELASVPEFAFGLQLGDTTKQIVHQAILEADCVTVPSKFASEDALALFPELKNTPRLHMVPFGVDPQFFTMPDHEDDYRPRQFLYVGALSPIKDFETMFRLIASMPVATLDIVGSGELVDILPKFAVELNILDRVLFHGFVPHQQMITFYQESKYLLITSRYEVAANTALEAMACGMTVIGTPVGILPEIGPTAPVGDIEALQALIIKRSRSQHPGQRHRHRWLIEHEYSIDHMLERFKAIYLSLASPAI
jgi:glycosyltransferase involved in cell wall biosynthesis